VFKLRLLAGKPGGEYNAGMSMFARAAPAVLALLLLGAPTGCERAHAPVAPRFRHDGYEAARAEARQRGLPLFVDVWASWCHTCMSMKEFVLTDPALSPLADAFVWLSLDSERPDSAPFLDRFKSTSLPTLWVIDPATQAPLLKWIGAATASELALVLADARTSAGGASPADAALNGEATALWLRGNRESAAGHPDQAIHLYRSALELGKSGWSKRALAVETLSMRLDERDLDAESFELAKREAPSLPKNTSLLNLLINGISAGARLPVDARTGLAPLIELGIRSVSDPELRVLVDDRSSLYMKLVEVLAKDDPTRSQRLAVQWSELLDREAARAKTPAERRVWDPHRLEAYQARKQPERAIPMLEQSEREQPDDYNPPARLARANLALGKLDIAGAAIDRAIERCSGPRRLRLYMLKADIAIAAQDRSAARVALDQALGFARSAKLPAQYDALRQAIERRILDLS
jgi:tetratricopeptide (TPR) repeat protein